MPTTEAMARIRLKTEQRIKAIMQEARKQEAELLANAKTAPHREAHFLERATRTIRLAEEQCQKLVERVEAIKEKAKTLRLKKLGA